MNVFFVIKREERRERGENEGDKNFFLLGWSGDKAFSAVVKTHKRRSNKIYNSELKMTKI